MQHSSVVQKIILGVTGSYPSSVIEGPKNFNAIEYDVSHATSVSRLFLIISCHSITEDGYDPVTPNIIFWTTELCCIVLY